MVEAEAKRVIACVEAGRYEDALSVELQATRQQINRAHMKLLARFRGRPDIRALLNEAKSHLTSESDLTRGRRFTRIGRKEEAVPYLVRGLEKGGSADDMLLAGQTLEQTWRIEEARHYFERAVAIRGEPTDYLWLGTVQSQLGEFENAEACFTFAVKQRGTVDDRRLLGSLCLKIGKLDLAEQQLRRAYAMGDLSCEQLLQECAAKKSRAKMTKLLSAVAVARGFAKAHPLLTSLAGVALIATGALLIYFG